MKVSLIEHLFPYGVTLARDGHKPTHIREVYRDTFWEDMQDVPWIDEEEENGDDLEYMTKKGELMVVLNSHWLLWWSKI